MPVPPQPLQPYEVAGAYPVAHQAPGSGYAPHSGYPPEATLLQATAPPAPSAPVLPMGSSGGGVRSAGNSWGEVTAVAAAPSGSSSLVPAGAAAPVVPPRRTSSSGVGPFGEYGDVEMAGRDADARSGTMRWGPVREEQQQQTVTVGRSASASGRPRRFQQVSL
jgi:hypothetical protein